MTKKQEIYIHVGFWTLFIGMDFYFNLISERDYSDLWHILQWIAFSGLQMIVFYLNYFVICPKTVYGKKWSWLIIGQLFLILLFPALRHLFEEIIIFKITGTHNYNKESLLTPFYVYDNSYYAIRIILYSLVFYFVKTIWNTNQKMNELLLQKKQAELQNLKNQLSPHFLFNTLNSFYADLMDINPNTADDLLKLSDMLRYVTYENENDKVYLKDEIQFIQNYIALFSRRFDNQLAVKFEFSFYDDKIKIPSLLLIHFVENAFKHGIATDADNPIKIELKTTKNQLNFTVANYLINSENYDEKGIGYKNVRQRLDILFSESYILDVKQTQEFYQVELQIPLS
ncbi:MAG: sensor histidine kinase [Flavobacterium sp.]|jgi:sensor histidine kinase YesM